MKNVAEGFLPSATFHIERILHKRHEKVLPDLPLALDRRLGHPWPEA
jgi:hypothetical protein